MPYMSSITVHVIYKFLTGYRPTTSNGYSGMTHNGYKPPTNSYKPSTDGAAMVLDDLNLSDDDTSLDTFSVDAPPVHHKSSKTTHKLTTDHIDSGLLLFKLNNFHHNETSACPYFT